MSRNITAGYITGVNSRETNGKFGPGFQFFVELDNGLTVSLNGKKSTPCGKDAQGNWAGFGIGGYIECVYVQNGEYNNSKSSDVTVTLPGTPYYHDGGGAAPAPQQAPQRQAAPPQRQGQPAPQRPAGPAAGPSNKTLEIKAGRACNNAALLLSCGNVSTIEDGLKEAIRLEVLSDNYYQKIYDKAQAELSGNAPPVDTPPQQTAPAPNPAPSRPAPQPRPQFQPAQAPSPAPQQPAQPPVNQFEDDGFDDDIPF